MTNASQWRRQVARYVADAYAAEPGVAATFIGGSAARGHADRYSDVEVGVFWHEPPTEEQRQRVMARIEADGKTPFPFDSAEQLWADDYFVGRAADGAQQSGLLVEVAGHTVQYAERIFDAVLTGFDPDPLKQNLISGILQAIPTSGHQLMAQMAEQVRTYPDPLATAVVGRYGLIDHFWRWQMWLARDNRMMFNQQMCDVQQRLLHMLLAVNRVYYFGFKWLPSILAMLPKSPENLASRMAILNDVAPPVVAESLRELVEETYTLVEAHVPGTSVEQLTSIFRWSRPQWGDDPPTYSPAAAERG
jgi:predicted nucleotidyltransferase